MSRTRLAGLMCEGHTDVPILRAAIQAVWPEVAEVRCIQPELDELHRVRGPAGWTQVKQWCEENAGRVDDVLNPDIGDMFDLLLVAMDVDVAVAAGITDPPHSIGLYESKRLKKTIRDWLTTPQRRKLPRNVVVSTPVLAIEAWIVAALFPRERAPETIVGPAEWLAKKKKLARGRDQKARKEPHKYQVFAAKVAGSIKRVRASCKEAHQTLSEIEAARSRARKNS